jgi:hypothetical protein
VQERIEQLRSYLDPSNPLYQPEPQHINIKAAITLYEDGKSDGLQRVYITSGKVVTREVADNNNLGLGGGNFVLRYQILVDREYHISMPRSMHTAMGLLGLIIVKFLFSF